MPATPAAPGSASSSRAADRAIRSRWAARRGARASMTATDSKTPSPRPSPWSNAVTTGSSAGTATAAPSRQIATLRWSLTGPACPTAGLGSAHGYRAECGAARRAAAGPRAAADRPAPAGARGGDGAGARHPRDDRRPAARGGGPRRRRARRVHRLPEPGTARAARPGLAHPPGQGGAGLPRRGAPPSARRLPVLRGDLLDRARPARQRGGTSGGRSGFHDRRGSRGALRNVPRVPRTSRIGAAHERLTPPCAPWRGRHRGRCRRGSLRRPAPRAAVAGRGGGPGRPQRP